MDKDRPEFTIKYEDIPLGSWDLYGNWYPNLNLKMSAADQYKHNKAGGHFKNVYDQRNYCTLLVADSTEYTDAEMYMLGYGAFMFLAGIVLLALTGVWYLIDKFL